MTSFMLNCLGLFIILAVARRPVVAERYSLDTCGEKNFVNPGTNHIVGGQFARPNTWPWVVSIRLKYGYRKHICGGALISRRVVLTAAHCLYKMFGRDRKELRRPFELVVGVGVTRKYQRDVSEENITIQEIFTFHPFHSRPDDEHIYDDDVALLHLSREPRNPNHTRPICLPTADMRLRPRQRCVIVGWGRYEGGLESKRLRHALAPVIPHRNCKRLWLPYPLKNNLCAGRTMRVQRGHTVTPIGPCKGDSGGPLMCSDLEHPDQPFHVFGVASWGSPLCMQKPAVFTDILKYVDWIRAVFWRKNWNLPLPDSSPLPNPECELAVDNYVISFGLYMRTEALMTFEEAEVKGFEGPFGLKCAQLCCMERRCKAIQVDLTTPQRCALYAYRHCDLPRKNVGKNSSVLHIGKSCPGELYKKRLSDLRSGFSFGRI